ncbi:MAG: glycosyltransferase family 4 protein [Anaerolineales bacterium]|nr:glycosyltransferase family 4 protein [Anaerolineales bacterium]
MHIAQFTNSYHPVVNGVVRSVSTFRRALAERGHNVFVFAQQHNDYEDQEPFIFRYPSVPLPISADVPAVIPISPFMDRLLPSLKLDVIHTHHPVLLGQVAANKAEELELPLVFTFHTQYREYTHYVPIPAEAVQDFLKETVHDWMQDFMRRCQHIVVPSESMLQILQNEYGLESDYTVIPTGIELAPYQQADGAALRQEHGWGRDPVLISIGRLGKEKNWELLLQATAQVLEHQPNLRLVLLGDGPHRQALEDYALELGIARQVTFTGMVPFEQVPAYLKAADLFGFTSTTETQGLVTMEALAAGLPVVAVEASGTRDIVKDEREGFLVEEEAGALASAITRLLQDPAALAHYQEAALARAQDFAIERLAARLEDVYQQASAAQQAGQQVRVRPID